MARVNCHNFADSSLYWMFAAIVLCSNSLILGKCARKTSFTHLSILGYMYLFNLKSAAALLIRFHPSSEHRWKKKCLCSNFLCEYCWEVAIATNVLEAPWQEVALSYKCHLVVTILLECKQRTCGDFWSKLTNWSKENNNTYETSCSSIGGGMGVIVESMRE